MAHQYYDFIVDNQDLKDVFKEILILNNDNQIIDKYVGSYEVENQKGADNFTVYRILNISENKREEVAKFSNAGFKVIITGLVSDEEANLKVDKDTILNDSQNRQLYDNFKLRKSKYAINEVILEDYTPESNNFLIEEDGFYSITLSGAGFDNINNQVYNSKFIDPDKILNKEWPQNEGYDKLTIKDFTWTREKQVNDKYYNDTGKWSVLKYEYSGTYCYSANMIVFSKNLEIVTGIKFDKTEDKYIELELSNTDEYVKYFGLLYSPINKSSIGKPINNENEPNYISKYDIKQTPSILAVFYDQNESDLRTNYNGSIVENINPIETGGTGELKRYVKDYTTDKLIEYTVGKIRNDSSENEDTSENEDKGNTIIYNDGIIAKGGEEIDIYNTFGGKGGCRIRNSFDLWEKNDVDEKGAFVKIQYIAPNNNIKIIDIEAEDITLPESNLKIAPEQIVEIYFNIKRNKELDIDNSKLDDTPISKLVGFTLTKIDNERRCISFKLPYKSVNKRNENSDFILNLKTELRKFYFACKRNKNIITDIEIDGELIEEGANSICKKSNGEDLYFTVEEEKKLTVKLTYFNESFTLIKDLIESYFNGIGLEYSITIIGNQQNITITMKPENAKDILLFFVTQSYLNLEIDINTSLNKNIDYVYIYYDDEGKNGIKYYPENIPENAANALNISNLKMKVIQGEVIKFKVYFKDDPLENYNENGSRYFELNQISGLKERFARLFITDRERNDDKYFIGEYQEVYLEMPNYDLDFYISDIDRGVYLDIGLDSSSENKIGHLVYQFPYGAPENNDFLQDKNQIKVMPKQDIIVNAIYKDTDSYNYYKLDEDFLKAQNNKITFGTLIKTDLIFPLNPQPKLDYVKIPLSFEDIFNLDTNLQGHHAFKFIMPNNDYALKVREAETRKQLTIIPNRIQFLDSFISGKDIIGRRIENIRIYFIHDQTTRNKVIYFNSNDYQLLKDPDTNDDIKVRLNTVDNYDNYYYDGNVINRKIKIKIPAGQNVYITVQFSDVKQKLDVTHLTSQIASVTYGEAGELSYSDDWAEVKQEFNFRMRDDLNLDLKWVERSLDFNVDFSLESLKQNAIYKLTKRNEITKRDEITTGNYTGSLKLYKGDKIEIEFYLKDYNVLKVTPTLTGTTGTAFDGFQMLYYIAKSETDSLTFTPNSSFTNTTKVFNCNLTGINNLNDTLLFTIESNNANSFSSTSYKNDNNEMTGNKITIKATITKYNLYIDFPIYFHAGFNITLEGQNSALKSFLLSTKGSFRLDMWGGRGLDAPGVGHDDGAKSRVEGGFRESTYHYNWTQPKWNRITNETKSTGSGSNSSEVFAGTGICNNCKNQVKAVSGSRGWSWNNGSFLQNISANNSNNPIGEHLCGNFTESRKWKISYSITGSIAAGGYGWKISKNINISAGEVKLMIEEGADAGEPKYISPSETKGGYGGKGGAAAYFVYNDEKGETYQFVTFGGGGAGGSGGQTSGNISVGGCGAGSPPRAALTGNVTFGNVSPDGWTMTNSISDSEKRNIFGAAHRAGALSSSQEAVSGDKYNGGIGSKGNTDEEKGEGGTLTFNGVTFIFKAAKSGFERGQGGGGGAPSCGGAGGSSSALTEDKFGKYAPIFRFTSLGKITQTDNDIINNSSDDLNAKINLKFLSYDETVPSGSPTSNATQNNNTNSTISNSCSHHPGSTSCSCNTC